MTDDTPANTAKLDHVAIDELQAVDIVRAAGDLFAQSTDHDARACRKFAELASNLLAHVATKDRRRFAARVSRHPQLPESVARMLATDVIGVAAPVLAGSPVLTSQDLSRLATEMSDDHCLAIAARRDLPPRLVSRLVRGDDNRLLLALARRHDIRLDDGLQKTFLRAGRKNKALASLLVRRQDIPPKKLAGLFLVLDGGHRLDLLADLERETLRDAARGEMPTADSSRSESLQKTIFAYAAAGDLQSVATHLSRATRIPRELVTEMMQDTGGEPLAVILLSAGLSAEGAIGVSLHAHPQIGRSVEQLGRLAHLIEQMSPAAARLVVVAMGTAGIYGSENDAAPTGAGDRPSQRSAQNRMDRDFRDPATRRRQVSRVRARGGRSDLQSR